MEIDEIVERDHHDGDPHANGGMHRAQNDLGTKRPDQKSRCGQRHRDAPLDEPLDDDVLGMREGVVDRSHADRGEHRLEGAAPGAEPRRGRDERHRHLRDFHLDQIATEKTLAGYIGERDAHDERRCGGAPGKNDSIGARALEATLRVEAQPDRQDDTDHQRADVAARALPHARPDENERRARSEGARHRPSIDERAEGDARADVQVGREMIQIEQRREVPGAIGVELTRSIHTEDLLCADRLVRERAERHHAGREDDETDEEDLSLFERRNAKRPQEHAPVEEPAEHLHARRRRREAQRVPRRSRLAQRGERAIPAVGVRWRQPVSYSRRQRQRLQSRHSEQQRHCNQHPSARSRGTTVRFDPQQRAGERRERAHHDEHLGHHRPESERRCENHEREQPFSSRRRPGFSSCGRHRAG